MDIRELAQKLGVTVEAIKMRGKRAGTPFSSEVPDLVAAHMIYLAHAPCVQCGRKTTTRSRYCSEACKREYDLPRRRIRNALHPLQSVHIAGIKGEDLRVRLSNEEKEEIRYRHKNGMSIHSLCKEYGVSRRLVQFTLFPERYEHAKMLARKRKAEGKYVPTRDENRKIKAEHRKHKRYVLQKKGMI